MCRHGLLPTVESVRRGRYEDRGGGAASVSARTSGGLASVGITIRPSRSSSVTTLVPGHESRRFSCRASGARRAGAWWWWWWRRRPTRSNGNRADQARLPAGRALLAWPGRSGRRAGTGTCAALSADVSDSEAGQEISGSAAAPLPHVRRCPRLLESPQCGLADMNQEVGSHISPALLAGEVALGCVIESR
jgi:hypothetical protein